MTVKSDFFIVFPAQEFLFSKVNNSKKWAVDKEEEKLIEAVRIERRKRRSEDE